MTSLYKTLGMNLSGYEGSYLRINPLAKEIELCEHLYISGDKNIDGSIRMIKHPTTGNTVLEKRVSSVWVPALFEAIHIKDKLYANDEKGYLQFGTSGDFLWRDVDNSTSRLNINGIGSYLTSPTGICSFQATDSALTGNLSGSAAIQLNLTTTESKFSSPNGINVVELNNTETNIKGAVSVCDGDGGYRLKVCRYGATHSGGAMFFEGAGDGVGGNYPDYHVDNFWGWMRIYAGNNSADQYVRLINAGSGGYKMNLQLDGGITVGDVSTGKTASAAIEIKSTTEALLVSRMTETQRDALTAQNGMVVYNTTTNEFNFYENGSWEIKKNK